MYFSMDSADVNSIRGLQVLLTDSKTSISCCVGASCQVFLLALGTWDMVFCSVILWIIFCQGPHLVSISLKRQWVRRQNSACAVTIHTFLSTCRERHSKVSLICHLHIQLRALWHSLLTKKHAVGCISSEAHSQCSSVINMVFPQVFSGLLFTK